MQASSQSDAVQEPEHSKLKWHLLQSTTRQSLSAKNAYGVSKGMLTGQRNGQEGIGTVGQSVYTRTTPLVQR